LQEALSCDSKVMVELIYVYILYIYVYIYIFFL
jgi:hypothetical protein